MKKIVFKIFALALAIMCASMAYASPEPSSRIVRKDSVPPYEPTIDDMVIVNGDTVSMIIPGVNYGRFDRGLFNYLYIPKKKVSIGLTASYGSLDTEDIEVLSVLDNVDFKGETFSINPSVSYFFKHNQSVGVRFTYTDGKADLASLALDIDDDLNFSLHDVSYHSHSYKWGLFYRNYVGLSRSKRFSVFNEVAFEFGTGMSKFRRYYDDELYNTITSSHSLGLNFSPGLCVFLQNNVAFNFSFGVFGLRYLRENQETNGVDEGSRTSSGANFKFNIFNIKFGLLVVI